MSSSTDLPGHHDDGCEGVKANGIPNPSPTRDAVGTKGEGYRDPGQGQGVDGMEMEGDEVKVESSSLQSTSPSKSSTREAEFEGNGNLLEDEEELEKPIDDDEFNIPQVDFEPTLESILNEMDEDSFSEGEDQGHGSESNNLGSAQQQQLGIGLGNSDTVSIVSMSSSDNKSRSSSRSFRPRTHVPRPRKKPNSILRHVLLKGMTSQLNSASEKISTGSATAIAIGSLIAVGTSHGFTLVFDVMQVVRWCFGEDEHREAGGAVSSLAVSQNGLRLLIGYAKGLILMYDLENGKLLRSMNDTHAVATAVLILRFTDHPILAMCSDSGGSVFELNFKRTMGVRSCHSKCIFSGSRGEVCTFEPLLLSAFPDNPLTRFVIVALATLSKVIVVMIRPKLKVLFTHSLPSDPTTLPLLAWQMVIIETTTNEKIVDPVLGFARSNVIMFYQVTLDIKNVVQFLPLRKITVGYSLLSMHWLNPRTLALIDTKEKLRVMDARTQEELESVDLSSARLVFASSHFKGLATGGNVSRAFALAGERSCYNSILCFNNQVIVLGTKSVHALTIRIWYERLDYLVRQHHYVEALQLGYELYLEKAKAVIGLRGSKDSKKMIVREKILHILGRYVDRIPSLNYLDDLNTAKQNYHEVISTCINYYVLLENVEPIFDQLYEYCSANPIARSAYLESLEPFILNDQLRAVPPTIVKDFVSYYEEAENFKPLEACIVHLNVDSLDIHQTMKICWTQGLYDAIMYIYNQGMNDYITPLEELMTELHSAISAENQLTDSQVILGNKILVYTSCCLAGRAYPYGNIPPHLVEKVQSDIFRIITTLHTNNASDNEPAYPYLRTFLQFDTREFLNVLSLSFEEPVFKTELGMRQIQRIIDILLQVMVENGNFTPTQIGILFTFVARQMAKPDSNLYVSKLLFEQVLEHLTSANETTRIDERQQALMELLQAGGLQHFDHNRLIQKCLNAKFFRVCEMLYERRNEYDKIINCYLRDDARSSQVFSFLHKVFSLFPNKKEEFQSKVKEYLEELVKVDNKKTAQVVYLHLFNLIPDLCTSLDSKPESQYLFLQGIFFIREQNQSNILMDTLTTEKCIDLLCRYNSQLVYPFLKSIDSYRLPKAMEICKKYNLIEAIGYLLEKDGKIREAFDLMMHQFKEKLSSIHHECDQQPRDDPSADPILSGLSWSQLQAIFLVIIQFSQRNSPKFLPEERERLWLPVLHVLIASHNRFQGWNEMSSAFNDMNKHLLSTMMGHVSLPTIVEVVMNNPSYQNATFGEIRDLVTGMLETCTYEEMMVDLVKRITQFDVHETLDKKCRSMRKGLFSISKICPDCEIEILSSCPSSSTTPIVVFQCGHSFHASCCEKNNLNSCPCCGSSSTELTDQTITERDLSFHFPRKRHLSTQSGSNFDTNFEISQEGEGVTSHAEFELKLDAPLKVSLKDF